MVGISYKGDQNDIPVTLTTPLPVVQQSSATTQNFIFTRTTTMSGSLVLKPTPGDLLSCYATTSTLSGYLMIFDATQPPPDGPVQPVEVVFCGSSSTTGLDISDTPEAFTNGIIAVFSSTGPFNKTAQSGAFIKGIAI